MGNPWEKNGNVSNNRYQQILNNYNIIDNRVSSGSNNLFSDQNYSIFLSELKESSKQAEKNAKKQALLTALPGLVSALGTLGTSIASMSMARRSVNPTNTTTSTTPTTNIDVDPLDIEGKDTAGLQAEYDRIDSEINSLNETISKNTEEQRNQNNIKKDEEKKADAAEKDRKKYQGNADKAESAIRGFNAEKSKNDSKIAEIDKELATLREPNKPSNDTDSTALEKYERDLADYKEKKDRLEQEKKILKERNGELEEKLIPEQERIKDGNTKNAETKRDEKVAADEAAYNAGKEINSLGEDIRHDKAERDAYKTQLEQVRQALRQSERADRRQANEDAANAKKAEKEYNKGN